MNNFKIPLKKIIIPIYLIIIVSLVLFTGLLGLEYLQTIVVPVFVLLLFTFFISVFLQYVQKDKFVAKAFLVSVLVHFIVALFINIVKYQLLGLPLTTPTDFSYIKIDGDARIYHPEGAIISHNLLYYLTHIAQTGYNHYSYVVGCVYSFFGINDFAACAFNSFVAGFIAIFVYKVSKLVVDIQRAKLVTYLSIFSFSILANTTILTRDVFIILFTYTAIYSSYLLYKNFNIKNIVILGSSLVALGYFRLYAAANVIAAITIGFFTLKMQFKYKNERLILDRNTFIYLFILVPVLFFGLMMFIKMADSSMAISFLSVEDLMESRDVNYATANTEFAIDMQNLISISPLLGIFVGYICMFFAPFPWSWFSVKNVFAAFYVIDTIVLYFFLFSFFKNVRQVFKQKHYILIVSFFLIFIMFMFYGLILKNAGAIFRLRGPFLPLIYLIALYKPDKFLTKIIKILGFYSLAKNSKKTEGDYAGKE